MADSSDTEPDSQNSVLGNPEVILSGPTASPEDSPQSGAISQIIQSLLHQPLVPFHYEEIEAASSTLILFVDDISYRLENDVDVLAILTTFASLGMSVIHWTSK